MGAVCYRASEGGRKPTRSVKYRISPAPRRQVSAPGQGVPSFTPRKTDYDKEGMTLAKEKAIAFAPLFESVNNLALRSRPIGSLVRKCAWPITPIENILPRSAII